MESKYFIEEHNMNCYVINILSSCSETDTPYEVSLIEYFNISCYEFILSLRCLEYCCNYNSNGSNKQFPVQFTTTKLV